MSSFDLYHNAVGLNMIYTLILESTSFQCEGMSMVKLCCLMEI